MTCLREIHDLLNMYVSCPSKPCNLTLHTVGNFTEGDSLYCHYFNDLHTCPRPTSWTTLCSIGKTKRYIAEICTNNYVIVFAYIVRIICKFTSDTILVWGKPVKWSTRYLQDTYTQLHIVVEYSKYCYLRLERCCK